MQVYRCQDTYTHIYSTFYDAWMKHRDSEVWIEFDGVNNQRLFATYHIAEESLNKVRNMEKMIFANMGKQTLSSIQLALYSSDEDKAGFVFRMLQTARTIPNSHMILQHLGDHSVLRVTELARSVGRESHLLQGFIRFEEWKSGVLFAEITPKNHVLTIFADFFQNRYPKENFIIYDRTHEVALVHPELSLWFLLSIPKEEMDVHRSFSMSDDDYSGLWNTFFQSVNIKERENLKCQRNLIPIHFRKNMNEFQLNK